MVLMHATGFSDELMLDLARQLERNLCVGSLICALTLRPPSAMFEVVDRFEIPCTWGWANAMLLRRVGGTSAPSEMPRDIAGIVGSAEFVAFLVQLLASPSCDMAREAAATIGFAGRVERTARQVALAGAIEPLVALLRRSQEHAGTSDSLVSLHAAAILAIRSLASHWCSREPLEIAGTSAALRELARCGSTPGVRAAASTCLNDFFD